MLRKKRTRKRVQKLLGGRGHMAYTIGWSVPAPWRRCQVPPEPCGVVPHFPDGATEAEMHEVTSLPEKVRAWILTQTDWRGSVYFTTVLHKNWGNCGPKKEKGVA